MCTQFLNAVRQKLFACMVDSSPSKIRQRCITANKSSEGDYLLNASTSSPKPHMRRIRKSSIRTVDSSGTPIVSVSEDVRRHFCTPDLESILRTFPAKFMRKKYRYPEHFYIADPMGARQIADHLLGEYDRHVNQPLIEVNPGPGLLTQLLHDSGRVRDLRLYEATREFIPSLRSRFVADGELETANDSNKQHCSLRAGDMLNLYRMSYQDKMDKGHRVAKFLSDLPQQQNWTDDPNVRLFACIGSVNFFKHLISSVVLQNDLLAFGRPDMMLVMPPPLYIHLTCDKSAGLYIYRSTTMLFQILFEHEFVARIPRKFFLPFQFRTHLEKYSRISSMLDYDRDYMYLVRVRPRRDLFEHIDIDQIQAMWYFIKQNCISRNRRVIPNLEKLIPGAGANLILDSNDTPPEPMRPVLFAQRRTASIEPLSDASNPCMTMSRNDRYVNMNIFTTFGDLRPSQILTLFHQFASWPGYERSAFQQGLEECLQKMEMSTAGIEDVLAEGSTTGDSGDGSVAAALDGHQIQN